MSLVSPTPASLLLRLRSQDDDAAWWEFVDLYTPLILGYLRHHGIRDEDACDVAQEVLIQVGKATRHSEYDSQEASFSGWLLATTRDQIRQRIDKATIQGSRGGTNFQQMLKREPALREDELLWERTHRLHLLQWAAESSKHEFEESTWAAFMATAFHGETPVDVAAELNMSIGAVYVAKSRVLARIRQVIGRQHDI